MDILTWCRENNREDILEQWDYEANSGILLEDVNFGSDKKYTWKCSEGHKWMDSPHYRTIVNSKCPYCLGKIALEGFNDLATTHPELVKEWDYENNKILPTQITKRNYDGKKVWWKCSKGHSYEAKLSNRIYLDRGCPYCSGNKLLTGFNDFETWCKDNDREDLLDEWNYEKNAGLKPRDVLQGGGNKKYWWKGSCGHEWDSVISSRTTVRQGKLGKIRTAGCPYCSNPPKRILVGFNDLETWCNNNDMTFVLDEWDYSKNGTSSPKDFTFGSGKSMWWLCNKKHSWRTPINGRTTGRTRCPICTRTQTSFPEQAIAFYLKNDYEILQREKINGKEVDIYIPEYKIAIEYDGAFWHSDEIKKKNDEIKSQKIINSGVTLIRLKEADNNKAPVYNNGYYSIEFQKNIGRYVSKDFEWALNSVVQLVSSITNRISKIFINIEKDEMSIRAYYMNVLKDNSVAMVFPELIDEWDVEKNGGITADAFSARNNQRVWWKCNKGHSWQASINTRTVDRLGCPYCAGQKITVGENDLETWCINNGSLILSEWDYEDNIIKPNEIPKTYKEKVSWKCIQGHKWKATVYNRINGTGCPKCNTGNNVLRNKVTLWEWCIQNNSNLCNEWNYDKNEDLTPEDVTYGSHKKVWWKCSKGHEWEAVVKSRLYNHGCPYCSGTNKRAISGVNDLVIWCKENNREYIISEWDKELNGDLTPNQVTWGSHKRIHWKCAQGHSWEAVVKERTRLRGNTCPFCRKDNL